MELQNRHERDMANARNEAESQKLKREHIIKLKQMALEMEKVACQREKQKMDFLVEVMKTGVSFEDVTLLLKRYFF